MPLWDSADLLARCKRQSGVPAVTAFPADADWFAWLTEKQSDWLKLLAVHVPASQYGAPAQLVTADAGLTYTFPGGAYPIGSAELRRTRNGAVMVPGPDWDPNVDYVDEGALIRFPGGKAVTFSDGPFARWVSDPGVLDGGNEPVIQPPSARLLLVYGSCGLYASRGGRRDPEPYLKLEREAAWGDPLMPGDIGIVGALKKQYLWSGAAAVPQGTRADWWRFIDDGRGYPTPT